MNIVALHEYYELCNSSQFKEATLEARVEMVCKKFPNWNRDDVLPVVKELVECDMRLTKLLVTETGYHDIEGYNYQVLNLEKIKHNEEFIGLWVKIAALLKPESIVDESKWISKWRGINGGYECLSFSESNVMFIRNIGFNENNAIQKSMKQFCYRYNINLDRANLNCCRIIYFGVLYEYFIDIDDPECESALRKCYVGVGNCSTMTKIVEALIL